MSLKAVVASMILIAAKLVAGHAAITNAFGDQGGLGTALGINPKMLRNGTKRNPFQQDSTRFRGRSRATVGETIGAGANSIEQGTQAIMAQTGRQLPQISPGGQLTMTVHQVNADGAGPFTCMINSDGTAKNFQTLQVTQNVAGNKNGRNRQGNASDNPLTVSIPANQQCSGNVAGQNNVCLVRCKNPAKAGPFGGVVPVQIVKQGSGQAGQKNNQQGNNQQENNQQGKAQQGTGSATTATDNQATAVGSGAAARTATTGNTAGGSAGAASNNDDVEDDD
ncbi:CAS1 protein [Hirsutella rhossiliensis]|uniref:CAS1 protein n=1 Tax=Hirsutella rhossiliensis TaxID=111463 RepID=A0A9P8N004_9HYPO|nr:CAS1 protein [Hirsutella rhossiliensis]KAH0963434.1 CAS1 protein [Hirsutella rhossiliensis]